MKFRVMMKTPDALEESVNRFIETDGGDEDTKEELLAVGRKWFKWGELLTVEIDTEAKTCTVLEI